MSILINLDKECIVCGICEESDDILLGVKLCTSCNSLYHLDHEKYSFIIDEKSTNSYYLYAIFGNINQERLFITNNMVRCESNTNNIIELLLDLNYRDVRIIAEKQFINMTLSNITDNQHVIQNSQKDCYKAIKKDIIKISDQMTNLTGKVNDNNKALLDTRVEICSLKKDINTLNQIMSDMLAIFKHS